MNMKRKTQDKAKQYKGCAMVSKRNLTISVEQQGIVLTEYLVGTAGVAFVLFAPIPGLGESAFVYLLDALRAFQANTTYLMSMP